MEKPLFNPCNKRVYVNANHKSKCYNVNHTRHRMEKCLQMSTVKAGVSVIHQVHISCRPTRIPVARNTGVRPSSSAHTFIRGGRCLVACNYSVNEVEAVTACSWTELVVAADKPVLVEFWGAECGPCQMLAQVAKEYTGKALCYNLNVDDYPNVALQYGITTVPSVLFYNNGESKEIVIGDVSKPTLCATLDKYL